MDRWGLERQTEGRLGLRREKKENIEMVDGSLARKGRWGEV